MPQLPSNMDININCDIIRERSALSSKASSRNSSVFSSTSFAPYYEYIELNNNLLDIEFPEPINSSQLSYADQVDVGESVRKVTDNILSRRGQYISNEVLVLTITSTPQGKGATNNRTNENAQDNINIQVLYDVN